MCKCENVQMCKCANGRFRWLSYNILTFSYLHINQAFFHLHILTFAH